MKESSIFNAQRSTSFQILYCVLVRSSRTPNRTMHGNKGWDGSKVHRNTETWTELMESQWNLSGIFSQDSPHCSSATKSRQMRMISFLSSLAVLPTCYLLHDSRLFGMTLRPSTPVFRCHRVSEHAGGRHLRRKACVFHPSFASRFCCSC